MFSKQKHEAHNKSSINVNKHTKKKASYKTLAVVPFDRASAETPHKIIDEICQPRALSGHRYS